MSEPRRIVLVGHCGPDIFMLRSALGRIVPDADIVTVNDGKTLAGHVDDGHALFVNRVLDGRFQDADGIDLIRRVAAQDAPPGLVLISNYEDAQADAVAAGAQPGFGKTELYDGDTADLVRDVVVRG